MKPINTRTYKSGNWYEVTCDDTAYFSKYNNLPEIDKEIATYSIQLNSLFKYDGCIYRLETGGEMTFCSAWDASGRLVIPNKISINGKNIPVTRIGHIERCNYIYTDYHNDRRRKPDVYNGTVCVGAFWGSKVAECIFPPSIQEIEEIIWGPCNESAIISVLEELSKSSLKEISFSEEEQSNLRSIDSEVFRYCNLDMGTLKLPEGLRQIGKNAFSGNFTKVICPSTLNKIDENAFFYCSIKGMKLNEGLDYLGPNFVDLYHFTEKLEIPSSIKVVPQVEWSLSERWELIKKLPTIVIHNSKENVEIDKTVKKTCIIQYVDASGKIVKKSGGIRNAVYKAKQPKSSVSSSGNRITEMEAFNGNVVSAVGIVCFVIFMIILFALIGILVGIGVLE